MRIPRLLHHKRTGWAFVVDPRNGKQVMLGHHGTVEAIDKYRRWVLEFCKQAKVDPAPAASHPKTVGGIMAAWLDSCHDLYRRADGRLTGEYGVCKSAVKAFLEYADRDPASLSGADMIAVRDQLSAKGLSRKTVHEYLGRFLRAMDWAGKRKWIPLETVLGLKHYERLRIGQAKASKIVEPIPPLHLLRIYRALTARWRPVMAWHLYTGQRVETALAIRVEDLDRKRHPWIYRPAQHKGLWRGHKLEILIGPRARTVLEKILKKTKEGYLFEGRSMLKARRYKGPRQHAGYRDAMEVVCRKLGIPQYTPRQIRHSAATWLRSHGIDEGIVGAILGHGAGTALRTGSHTITGRYAAIHRRTVEEVVERFG